jgi:hypothetical protein
MESGLERQINEFLEKFSETSARAVEDDILFSGVTTARSSKLDMEDGLEMMGKSKSGC